MWLIQTRDVPFDGSIILQYVESRFRWVYTERWHYSSLHLVRSALLLWVQDNDDFVNHLTWSVTPVRVWLEMDWGTQKQLVLGLGLACLFHTNGCFSNVLMILFDLIGQGKLRWGVKKKQRYFFTFVKKNRRNKIWEFFGKCVRSISYSFLRKDETVFVIWRLMMSGK